jgi:hypothetical protein
MAAPHACMPARQELRCARTSRLRLRRILPKGALPLWRSPPKIMADRCYPACLPAGRKARGRSPRTPLVLVHAEENLKLPRVDSNHDSQIQNLKSYRLDDRAKVIKLVRFQTKTELKLPMETKNILSYFIINSRIANNFTGHRAFIVTARSYKIINFHLPLQNNLKTVYT